MILNSIQNIFIFLIVAGFIIILVDYVHKSTLNQCPKKEIIYKYIPRSFNDEQEDPLMISEIFDSMFKEPSPWLASIGSKNQRETK